LNAPVVDVATDECFEEAVRSVAAAEDGREMGRDTQLSTARNAKAPLVPPAASVVAVIDEPKRQVRREMETKERPPSPSTLQLAMEAQQLLRKTLHARSSFQKTPASALRPKKHTILMVNEQTHHLVPLSKSKNPVVDQQLFGKTEDELPVPIKNQKTTPGTGPRVGLKL
jgi:hypothetical protein